MLNRHPKIGDLAELVWPPNVLQIDKTPTTTKVPVSEFEAYDFGPDDPFFVTVDGLVLLDGRWAFWDTNEEVVGIMFVPCDPKTGERKGTCWWMIDASSIKSIVPGKPENAYHHEKRGKAT